MNTNSNTQNGSAENVEVNNNLKRGPGRPPKATRVIYLNMDKTPRTKGRPKPGTQYIKAVINNGPYVVGQTPILNQEVLVAEAKVKNHGPDIVVENRQANQPQTEIVAAKAEEMPNVSPNGTVVVAS